MDWTQTISLMAIIISAVAYLHHDVNRIHNDLKAQGARTDKLYEMFVDLLKERKK